VRLLRVRLAAAFRLVGVAMDRIDRFLLLLLLFQHKRIQELFASIALQFAVAAAAGKTLLVAAFGWFAFAIPITPTAVVAVVVGMSSPLQQFLVRRLWLLPATTGSSQLLLLLLVKPILGRDGTKAAKGTATQSL